MDLRPSRHVRLIATLGILAVVVTAVLALLPELVRRLAVGRLETIVAAPVSIQDVDMNLFTGTGKISGLLIGNGGISNQPVLRLPVTDLHFSALDLVRGKIIIHTLALRQPQVRLVRNGPARFNVTDVLRLHGNNGGSLEFTIEQTTIEDGTIAFLDRTVSPQFEHTFKNINLRAGRISSLPKFSVRPTSFALGLSVDGGSITMTGEATPIARPAGIQVQTHWKNLNPALFEAYIPGGLRVDLSGSRSSGDVQYVLTHGGNKANELTASFDAGPARLFLPQSTEPKFSVKDLKVRKLRWDFLRDHGRMEELFLEEPHLLLERMADGTLSVSALFRTSEKAPGNSDDQSENKKEQGIPVKIERLHARKGAIEWIDNAVSPVVQAPFQNVELNGNNLDLSSDAAPANFMAQAQLGGCPVQINGSLQFYPFASRLDISTKNLPIHSYQGYLRAASSAISQWAGKLSGKVQLEMVSHEDAFGVALAGKISATHLSLALSDKGKPPFQAQAVDLQLADLHTYPSFYMDVAELQFRGTDLRIRRRPDGSFNLTPLWSDKASSAKVAPANSQRTQKKSEPSFVIRRLTAQDGSIHFADETVKPAFETTLTKVEIETGRLGQRSGFTSVSLRAGIEENAELELKGSIKPFETPAQIKLDGVLRDYDLAELNPYAAKFIQYEIERGRANTDVQYRYDAGDLNGENKITIRRFQLGERLGDEFQNRIGISLRLAVALLQDADGSIRLAIPVSGNLSDPQFDWGGLVWRALRNAMVKFISAPLRLLGNIVTLGGRINRINIGPVEFEPGSIDLKPGADKQIEQLARMLKERPKLELQLQGLASPEEIDALKRARLRRQIAESGEDYETAIVRLYRLARSGNSDSTTRPTVAHMQAYLAQRIVLPENALQNLATRRTSIVEGRLSQAGIQTERLFTDSRVADDLPGRVEFELLA